jgi:hypothetical protein
MWLLEFAKNRILGVDTLGQHVPPHVWYGATCLLIKEYYMLCVLLGGVGIGMVIRPAHMVQVGPMGETLALQAGPVEETVAKYDILL